MFPLMEDENLRKLAEDIRVNGQQEPITIYQNMILDGRNRYKACELLRIKPNFTEYTGKDPRAFVVSMNIQRRHLSAEQKRDLIAKVLKADPTKSDRQVAEVVKVDNKTVGAVREKLEAREEIPHVETRTDSAGRKQPKKKSGTKTRTAAQVYHAVQEQLIDALQELSSIEHAEEHAEKTKTRLDETIASMRKEEREAA
jgi:ParB-like chromosome segregation protein Spo0J